jgi:glutamine synthetase adenylyltransferase
MSPLCFALARSLEEPLAEARQNQKTVRDIEKRLDKLERQMKKLSEKRDNGKLPDSEFYASYLPLQELSLQLAGERASLTDSYRPR